MNNINLNWYTIDKLVMTKISVFKLCNLFSVIKLIFPNLIDIKKNQTNKQEHPGILSFGSALSLQCYQIWG